MTLRSLICFSLAACAPLAAATLSGSVQLRDSKVEAVTKLKDYSGVIVSAQPVSPDSPPPLPRRATMLQKNKLFLPHLLAIPTGTTVDFPNADPIFHNAFSSYSGQIFDVGLYAPGTNRSVRFSRAGAVRVFCNIHPAMSAVILVLDTPYFAITARDGTFELNVPPGDYDVRVFHERSTEQTLANMSLRIVVGNDATRLPAIAVSEAGYLQTPHKDKYGRAYQTAPDDQGVYPVLRR